VADATGTTVWRWEQQEPFGNNPADEDPDANSVAFDLPLRLPGQRYDRESGLAQNWNRDYWPEGGRYVQSDPIGLVGGINTFAYVASSPLRYDDPLGLDYMSMYPMINNEGYWRNTEPPETPKCSEICLFEVKPDCRPGDTQCAMASAAAGLRMSTKSRFYSCKCVLTFGLIGKVGGAVVGQRVAKRVAATATSPIVKGAAAAFASPAATVVGGAYGLITVSNTCEVIPGEDCCK